MLRLAIVLLSAVALVAEEGEFAGATACKACHTAQFASQSVSGHANSLARAENHRLAAIYGPLVASRKPPVEWAFGAGKQAVTFVSRVDENGYLEHHLSYYSALKTLAATPGHQDKTEPGVGYKTFGPDAGILRCFQCHSTGLPRVDEANHIEPAELGVKCETCHGPGRTHAQSPKRDNVATPARYSAEELNQFCGSCHRKPAAAGDDTDFSNAWNARHQPLYFSRSQCFLKSGGRLSCFSCHPPHGGAVKNICADCHGQMKHPAALRVAGRTCPSCHMPDVKPTAGLRFANHWIGIYREGQSLTPRR